MPRAISPFAMAHASRWLAGSLNLELDRPQDLSDGLRHRVFRCSGMGPKRKGTKHRLLAVFFWQLVPIFPFGLFFLRAFVVCEFFGQSQSP